MKKVIITLGILLLALAPTASVYAGSLNAYENEVIAAAKQIYEFEGIKYQVEDTFISQLVDYLSADGVDLNAEQRDEVLQTAFASVERGVTEGYLLPVPGQDIPEKVSTENSNQGEPSSPGNLTNSNTASVEDQSQEESEEVDNGSTNTSDNTEGLTQENTEESITSDDATEDTLEDPLKDPSENSASKSQESASEDSITQENEKKDSELSSNNTDGTATKDTTDRLISNNEETHTSSTNSLSEEELISAIMKAIGSAGQTVTVGKEEVSTGQTNDEVGSSETGDVDTLTAVTDYSKDTDIIKKTGFDFRNTVIMIAGIGMLMLAGLYVTRKTDLFAHDYEE